MKVNIYLISKLVEMVPVLFLGKIIFCLQFYCVGKIFDFIFQDWLEALRKVI